MLMRFLQKPSFFGLKCVHTRILVHVLVLPFDLITFLCFVYFRLFMTFVHISTSPVLASLSGNDDIASMALSTYSCANARVCCSPVLFETISLAWALISISHIANSQAQHTLWTSPSTANFLPTNLPKLLLSFHANNSGAVASPSSRSAPAGFPSSSPLMV
jgi:hypothetical protein